MLSSATIKPAGAESVGPPVLDASEIDGDLRLATLARAAGASPSHFQRRFSKAAGESPKRHVMRLRLEKAAWLLRTTERRVLDIGLTVGFNGHETFSRAFKRAFGRSPTTYRREELERQASRMKRNRSFRGACCRLSEVRWVARAPMFLAGIRRTGAYADFPAAQRERLWDEVEQWARTKGLAVGPERLGLYPDDPVVTPGPRQRADVCLATSAPVVGDDRIRPASLPGGTYAVVDHFGPYETLIQAHRALIDGVRRAGSFVPSDHPAVHWFQTTREGGDPSANRTQVWLHVRRSG